MAVRIPSRGLELWSAPHSVPAWPFAVRTADDLTLRGHRLGESPTPLVLDPGASARVA